MATYLFIEIEEESPYKLEELTLIRLTFLSCL